MLQQIDDMGVDNIHFEPDGVTCQTVGITITSLAEKCPERVTP